MIVLKQVIHDAPTNSVEATWVERTVTPPQGVEGEDGYQPEQVTDVQIKCHSYDQTQMDMLEADIAQFGGDLNEHAALIARVRNNQIPVPPAPVFNVKRITKLSFIEWCETNGKLDALIALLSSDAMLKFKWDAATSLEIGHPLVIGAAQALGITDPQAVFNGIGQA